MSPLDENKIIPAPGALIAAASRGDWPLVEDLIAAGADIHEKNRYDNTVLIFVAEGGQTHLARQLLAKGADVDACSSTGLTALMYAVKRSNPDMVGLLLEKGANPDIKEFLNRSSALDMAEDSEIRNILTRASEARRHAAEEKIRVAAEKRHRVIREATVLQHNLRTKRIFKRSPGKHS